VLSVATTRFGSPFTKRRSISILLHPEGNETGDFAQSASFTRRLDTKRGT
jgi:hypothetical protein